MKEGSTLQKAMAYLLVFPSFLRIRLGLSTFPWHFWHMSLPRGTRELQSLQMSILDNALSAIGNLPIRDHYWYYWGGWAFICSLLP